MRYDIHCHLDSYEDPDGVVSRAKAAGVALILTNGTSPLTNRAALALAESYPEVEAALGLYPTDAIALSEKELAQEIAFIREHDPVAIGEVGLDYHWDDSKKEEMKAVFSRIIDLAEELHRPLLVHSRKAEADVLDMLEGREVVVDLHCFGGSLKLARRAAAMGCYFSIPATIARATHFQRLVEEIPIEQLLTETDSPWMAPVAGELNEPSNVALIAGEIARLKGIPEERCEDILWANAQRFLQR